MANANTAAQKPVPPPPPAPAATTAVGASPAKPPKPEIAVETVKMLDGRLVEFPGKRRLQKESFISAQGQVSVRLDFRNGETRTFKIAPSMVPQFAAHGAEQKLGDEISGVEDIDDAVEAIDELIMRLDAGEWTVRKEGGAGAAGSSVLLQAICKVTGQAKDKIRLFLKDLDNRQKAALREADEFRIAIKEIEAEKASKRPKVDITAAMAKLKAL